MFSSLIKHFLITVSIVGMILFNVFGPYYLILSFPKNNKVELGVHYHYLDAPEIYSDLVEMNATGFKVIKIGLFFDPNDFNSHVNNKTDIFFRLAKSYMFNFEVSVIVWYGQLDLLVPYLQRWGKYVDYIQVLNEPDVASAWGLAGALYMDEEILVMAKDVVEKVRAYNKEHNMSIKLYTNLTPAVLIRSNVPMIFSNLTDFLGFDLYYTAGVFQMAPFLLSSFKVLAKNKTVIISEFGVCEMDDDKQASLLIEGLNFFKNYGISRVWITHWRSEDPIGKGYTIAGRKSQSAISEWLKRNA